MSRFAKTNEPDRVCCCCEKEKVPVIFRDGSQVMILTCDACGDPMCRDCSDEDKENGIATCSNCLQDEAIRGLIK